ncbi:hypothetical protein [Christiangramia sabulilitoris]|uniref:DUF4136 domain-containing protein n=1 Tax=Christiangramia sabulilitoris TaxID=2583991 RepID=A0A550I0D7_9FLAO|nr:hypothetical protein [Christiangramia sabulilitoris]TRO64400.1 hypothetical protein FGM01_12985 [Christiangramia sabulilitoris]
MKRFLLLSAFLFLSLTSCHTPSYTFTRNSSNSFQPIEGKYLVNYIDSPEAVRTEFQDMLLEKFPKNTHLAQNSGVAIFPVNIPENPGSEKIKDISATTGDFDYLINIKANISSDNIDAMQIGNLAPSDSNETFVALEIFDLNNPGTIFYSRVRAYLQDRDDSQDFSFGVSSNTMLKKSLKKILRRIDNLN